MSKITKFQYIVTVEVHKDIAKRYPNYNINWDTFEDFADSRIDGLVSNTDYELTLVDSLKEDGFRIRAEKI